MARSAGHPMVTESGDRRLLVETCSRRWARHLRIAKESYYFLYYTLYRADLFNHGRAYNEWKAFVLLGLLQLFLVFTADHWAWVLSGQSYLVTLPKPVLALACLALAAINHRLLFHERRWELYARRFEQYPPAARRIRTRLAVAFMLSVVAFLGYSLLRIN